MPIGAGAFGRMVPAQAGPNLVKSMDEQQYAQNLQADGGGPPMALDSQKGKYANLSASTERTKSVYQSPKKAAGMANLQEPGASAVDGPQEVDLTTGAPGEALMFAGSQMSIMQSQSPTGLRASQPGGEPPMEQPGQAVPPKQPSIETPLVSVPS